MKSGFRTSEFALAAAWWALAALAIVASSFMDWPLALAFAPCASIVAYMAGLVCNNYAENRWQLKAAPLIHKEEEDNKPKFGFGRFVASEEEESEE